MTEFLPGHKGKKFNGSDLKDQIGTLVYAQSLTHPTAVLANRFPFQKPEGETMVKVLPATYQKTGEADIAFVGLENHRDPFTKAESIWAAFEQAGKRHSLPVQGVAEGINCLQDQVDRRTISPQSPEAQRVAEGGPYREALKALTTAPRAP